MMSILRKNNKKILAVLGVFLMIAFIVPSTTKNQLGRPSADRIGVANGEALTHGDLVRAESDLQALRHTLHDLWKNAPVPQAVDLMTGEVALRMVMSGSADPRSAVAVGHRIVGDLDATTFALLLREARKMGVRPDPEMVKLTVERSFPTGGTSDVVAAQEQAAADWLTIVAAFNRVSDAAKVSPAVAEHLWAAQQQKVALEMVEFRAEQFTRDVPEPDAKALEEFFKKYQDVDPAGDPHGIGYRVPNRLRIEWVMVPYQDIRNTVTSDEAADYYRQHKAEFMATTQPATRPSTQAAAGATRPATAPATEPVPYQRVWAVGNDVDREIRDKLAEERTVAAAKAIQTAYANDYAPYHAAAKEAHNPRPASAPPTSVGPAYYDPQYTIQLAKRVQKREARNVLPVTVEEGELRSEKQINEVPPFNGIRLGSVPFGTYLFAAYDQFTPAQLTPQQRSIRSELLAQSMSLLTLYKATGAQEPLRDAARNYYIVRVVEAEAAHPAASLQAVRDQVKKDFVTLKGFDKAREAARQCAEAARKQGLEAAAAAAGGRPIVKTNVFNTDPQAAARPFGALTGPQLIGATLPANMTGELIDGGIRLLQERLASGQEHPIDTLEFPRALTVATLRLADARPASAGIAMLIGTMQNREGTRLGMQAIALATWLNPDAVAQRMNWVPEQRDNRPRNPNSIPQEPAPIGQ